MWPGYETWWVYRWLSQDPDDMETAREAATEGTDALRECLEGWAYGDACPPLAAALVREFLDRVDWTALQAMLLGAVPEVPTIA